MTWSEWLGALAMLLLLAALAGAGYLDAYDAVREQAKALAEMTEQRDRYLREVTMQRNALQDIAGEALYCKPPCKHWAGDRAIGPAHKARETLERADRESWEPARLAATAETGDDEALAMAVGRAAAEARGPTHFPRDSYLRMGRAALAVVRAWRRP